MLQPPHFAAFFVEILTSIIDSKMILPFRVNEVQPLPTSSLEIIYYVVKYKNILSIIYSIYMMHCHLNSSCPILLKATSYTLRKNSRTYQNHTTMSLCHSSEDNLFLSPYLAPVQFAETVADCSY